MDVSWLLNRWYAYAAGYQSLGFTSKGRPAIPTREKDKGCEGMDEAEGV
jgi:hypothetical protein